MLDTNKLCPDTLFFRDHELEDDAISDENIQSMSNDGASELQPSVSIPGDKYDAEIEEINALMPVVLKTLADSGTKESFLAFFRLVNSNSFPLDNIEYHPWIEILN